MNDQVSFINVQSCNQCHERATYIKGLCHRCYSYQRTHNGRPRPAWTRPRITLCIVCRQREAAVGPRCTRCVRWLRAHGYERPLSTKPRNRTHTAPRPCRLGCGRGAVARGLCASCVKYYYRNGKERPAALIERAKGG